MYKRYQDFINKNFFVWFLFRNCVMHSNSLEILIRFYNPKTHELRKVSDREKNILKYTISFEIGIDNRCHILSEKLEQKKGNYTKNSYNLVFETADGVLLQLGNDECSMR